MQAIERTSALILIACCALLPAAVVAQVEAVCIPTCDETDSRLLAVTPEGVLASLSPQTLSITIAIAGDRSTFELGVFDGDGGDPPLPNGHWDLGQAEIEYRLYEDPEKDGVHGETPIRVWGSAGGPDNPLPMPDNDWFDSGAIPTAESARADSGNFFYSLEVDLVSAVVPESTLAAFKIRSSGPGTIEIFQQPFAFLASITSGLTDARVVYPDFPNLSPTTYDGTITFFVGAETSLEELRLFDGDLDYGNKVVGGPRDTDDGNTPNDDTAVPFVGLPLLGLGPWALSGPTFYEGVACSDFATPGPAAPCSDGAGEPQEDSPSPIFRRSPAVEYEVVAPDGRRWRNSNPSGNREWEEFRVGTEAGCQVGVNADYCETELLPAGVYEVRVEGLDMQNLNFLFFTLPLRCVKPDGSPCEELREFLVGDTVFEDPSGDGIQQAGEPGIPAVVTALVDENGSSVNRAVTDGEGLYGYPVDAGEWSVRVIEENFRAFAVGGAVGDRVWLDVDGDGLQDAGERGMPSVEVRLYEAGGDGAPGGADDVFLGSAVTDSSGHYLFTGLAPGTYFAAVVDPTLAAGLSLSGGTDPSASRLITAGERFVDLDFGYVSSGGVGLAVIGDRVWLDADGDSMQDPAEPGIDRVTLELVDGGGDGLGGGNDTVLATAETAGGYYLFSNVAPGSDYAVRVTDEHGVLAGFFATTTPNPIEQISVTPDGAYLLADFGYNTAEPLYAIHDVAWYDADRDGLFDAWEPPLGGVTVALADAMGDVIAEAVSASDGGFSFADLPAGSYTILITDVDAALNGLLPTTGPAAIAALSLEIVDADIAGVGFGYVAGGSLQGALATTESPTQTDVVVDRNVLDYDFGYRFVAGGTGTPGYWKNHPDAWPVGEISLGGVLYGRQEAIFILDHGEKKAAKRGGDKTYTLAAALISAKLNTLTANDDVCSSYLIYLGDLWLQQYPVGSDVRGDSEAWKQGEPVYWALDDYNNGRLCAPPRD